jgi:hypothetical protein
MREFPARLPHQPIFYPVTSREYARQIARDWNTQDDKSGFSGFVTSFEVQSEYILQFDRHTVGSSDHVEYWIPASELQSFNGAINGLIHPMEAFFGKAFTGHVPVNCNLKGRDARAQFVALSEVWDYSSFDVFCEVSANRKAVFLNWMFWKQNDFSDAGINREQQRTLIERLEKCWTMNHIEVPLPSDPTE